MALDTLVRELRMSAAVRGRPSRRLDQPIVAVLEKRGRFLVAEPIFGPGPRTAVDRRRDRGRPRARGRRQARRARVLRRIGPAGQRARRRRGPDARPRPPPQLLAAATAEAEAACYEPYAADARVDLRDLPTFTVDPDDAKDFDDADLGPARARGRVRVWVHIAT